MDDEKLETIRGGASLDNNFKPKTTSKRVWPDQGSPREVLTAAKESIQSIIQDEAQYEAWGVYESHLSDYEKTFSDLLRQLRIGSLEGFIERKRAEGKPATVIDFMGAGQALRDFPYLDYGLAVTLFDKRSDEQRERDEAKNIEVVAGSLLTKNTWEDIRAKLKKRGIDKVSLLMCRGVAGIDTIPEYFQTSLVGRGYQLLTNDDGLFITEAHWSPGDYNWIKKLIDLGLEVKMGRDDSSMAFVKVGSSPMRLPL